MLSRQHISSFVGLTIVAWLLLLWLLGQPVLSWLFLRPFGLVVTLIMGVTFVFGRWAWAWPILRGWYVKRPDLRGTWKVVLASDWVDPATGKRVDPISGYLVIRQTLLQLSARLITSESTSRSVAYSLAEEGDEISRLAVIYRNEPRIDLQGTRSNIHHGSFWVEFIEGKIKELRGHYWTDRSTRGEMQSVGHVKEYHDSWKQAEAVFGSYDSSEQGAATAGEDAAVEL